MRLLDVKGIECPKELIWQLIRKLVWRAHSGVRPNGYGMSTSPHRLTQPSVAANIAAAEITNIVSAT